MTIAVAEDLSGIESALQHLQQRFALLAILLLLALIIIQLFILHIGLRPLNRTRKELQSLSQGHLSQLTSSVPSEVSPLVDEVNHLLEVLGTRLNRSRNALGDLAHALKKPLTVLQQLGHEKTLNNDPELQQAITTQLETIQRLIRRILQRARLAGEGPVGSYFQPEQDIPPLLNMLRSMYHHKSLVFESDIEPGIHIAADREDMLELIGNLLDNACKWARHKVCFMIQHEHGILISVEDDGPGVSQDQLGQLTQRGQRLDEQTEGHGLGLSISRDIVDSLDGKLQLQRSEQLGGLLVTIQLPG